MAMNAPASWLHKHPYVLLILPAFVLVAMFTAYPAIYGIYISFTNMHFAYPDSGFVGLRNYVKFFTSPDLAHLARTTFLFVVPVVLLQVGGGLAVALLLNVRLAGRRAIRSIVVLPWVIPSIVVAVMFQHFFSGSSLGTMNTLLGGFGITRQAWLTNSAQAMIIMIGALAWRGIPFAAVLLLSALQTIPRDLYEAAEIDGAGRWQKLLFITLPYIAPLVMINLIMSTAGTLNTVDIPLALTGGGPGNSTEVLSLALYKQGFVTLDAGYASTIATITLALNLVLTIVYLMLLRRRENE